MPTHGDAIALVGAIRLSKRVQQSHFDREIDILRECLSLEQKTALSYLPHSTKLGPDADYMYSALWARALKKGIVMAPH